MSRIPGLLLAYLHRIGSTPTLRNGKLTISNASRLDPYDRGMVQFHKGGLIHLLQRDDNVDDFRWDHRVDHPEHRARALPRSLPEPPGHFHDGTRCPFCDRDSN